MPARVMLAPRAAAASNAVAAAPRSGASERDGQSTPWAAEQHAKCSLTGSSSRGSALSDAQAWDAACSAPSVDKLGSSSGELQLLAVSPSGGGVTAAEDAAADCPDVHKRFGIDYLRHPVAAYGRLPAPLRQILAIPTPLSRLMVAARPTIEPSGGLRYYREAVPRAARRWSPLFAVVDEPGLPADAIAGQGGKYWWTEIPIPPVYRLDVQGLTSYEQYVQERMGKNQRRNHRQRQQKWAEAGCLTCTYEPLAPGNRQLVKQLWRLYKMNGQRNGQLVVCKKDFTRIHLQAQGLSLMLVRDTSRGGAIVSFATGLKCGDTLISTWCGTDYAHPLSRQCSCYVMTQYAFVRLAIEDPEVRWLDLGALHRTIKHGSLCAEPHPVSTYVRCKSRLLSRLVTWGARRWFTLERLQATGMVHDV